MFYAIGLGVVLLPQCYDVQAIHCNNNGSHAVQLMVIAHLYRIIGRFLVVSLVTVSLQACVSSALDENSLRTSSNGDPPSENASDARMSEEPIALSPQQAGRQPAGTMSGDGAGPTNTTDSAITEADRQRGVDAIREKATARTGNEKPTVGPVPEAATSQLSTTKRDSSIRELEAAAQSQQQAVGDAELQSKRRSTQQLLNQARKHYLDALENIEN